MIEFLGWTMLISWGLGAVWALYILWMSRDGREVYPTIDDEPLVRGRLRVIKGGRHDHTA
jgi:hypothetical protein